MPNLMNRSMGLIRSLRGSVAPFEASATATAA
jgi:hypothetical protein